VVRSILELARRALTIQGCVFLNTAKSPSTWVSIGWLVYMITTHAD
jgi:hypothetical protein